MRPSECGRADSPRAEGAEGLHPGRLGEAEAEG